MCAWCVCLVCIYGLCVFGVCVMVCVCAVCVVMCMVYVCAWYVYMVYVCGMCVWGTCMRKSEDDLMDPGLLFHLTMGSGDGTQVIMLPSKRFSLLNHLDDPHCLSK